jgi:hypothetical protein
MDRLAHHARTATPEICIKHVIVVLAIQHEQIHHLFRVNPTTNTTLHCSYIHIIYDIQTVLMVIADTVVQYDPRTKCKP